MRSHILAILSAAILGAAMTVEAPAANAYCDCHGYGHGYGYGVGRYGVGVRGVARRTTRRVIRRRSDARLKHDIVLLGRMSNGLGLYRFSYNGSNKAYVGVIAQEVQSVDPSAVSRGNDGYLRVSYEQVGVKFQTYDHWIASGGNVPIGVQHTD